MEAIGSDIALKRRLEAAIEATILSESAFLAAGSVEDFADYKFRAGRIQGLRAALGAMQDIADQMMGKSPEGRTNG